MQNWDSPLPPVNYEHNWYGNMFPATHIKTEPQSIPSSQSPPLSVMEHFLKQQTNPNVDMTSSTSLTPSPRQENNDNHNFFGTDNVNSIATPMSLNNPHIHPLGFNPLTPPGLPNAILPPLNFHHHQQTTNDLQQNNHHDSHMQSPPPSNCNTNNESTDGQNQQTNDQQQDNHLQQNGGNLTKLNDNNSLTPRNTPPMDITPPKSPKHYNSGSEYLEKDPDAISNSSDFVESEDDDIIRMPIYNSHGKMKNYKCKSCGYNAITKIAFWTHTRSHMKPEKIMQCPKCPFVTELKHHLEYHIRKHKNLKPFQCDKCNYSCVNKSMLNSHLKSHSSVYQYRCSDCDYATKYCHSFKLHLRKYDHKPGLVLDEEGLPNPAIIIDVYGTRRGPKTKSVNGRISHKSSAASKMANSVHAMNQLNAQKSNLSSPLKATNVSEIRQAKTYNMMNLSQQNPSQQQQQQQQQRLQQQPLLQPNQMQNNSSQQNFQQHQSQQQNQQQQQHPPQIPSPAAQMPNFLPNPLANMLQQRNMPAFFPYWNLNLQMLAAQQQAVLAQLSPRMRDAAIQSLKLQQQQTNGCNNLKIESEQFNELQRKSGSQYANDSEDLQEVHGDDEDEDIADNEEDDNDRRSESSAMDLSSQGTPTKVQRSSSLNFGESVGDMLHLSGIGGENGTDILTPITFANGNGSSSRRKGRVLKLETLLQNKESSISSNDDSLKIIPNEMDNNNFKTGGDIIEESNNNIKIGNHNNQMIRKSTSTPNNNINHSNNNNGNNLRISSTSSSSDELTIVEEDRHVGEREQRLTILSPPIPTETSVIDCSSNSNSSCNNGNSNSNTNNLINDNQNKNNNSNNNNNNSNNNNNYNNNSNNNGNNVNNNNNINKFNNNNANNNNNNSNSNNNNNSPLSGIFECKFCDIYFKDAVLYTIHMGYHSCDDVFKCNMCGEKCDGPVGLFVHMARNAHS